MEGAMPSSPCILKSVGAVMLLSRAWAQDPLSQPQIWAKKPGVSAFEKLENDRLIRAQQAIQAVVAVKADRTIQNTVVPYDEAILQLDNASYFARLIEAGHPDSAVRDRGSEMLRRVNAAVASLSLNRSVYEAL